MLGLLIASVAGCTSAPAPSQPGASVTPTGKSSEGAQSSAEPADCQARIEGAVLAKPETIALVDDCRFTNNGLAAARSVLAAGGSRDVIWAAVWVYGSTSGDPEPLRPVLSADDQSLRAMAAASLARAGDRDGLTALRKALDADGLLLGSTAPLPIARFAAISLSRVVTAAGTPLIIVSESSNAQFTADWRTWFDANGAALAYDDKAGEWRLP